MNSFVEIDNFSCIELLITAVREKGVRVTNPGLEQ